MRCAVGHDKRHIQIKFQEEEGKRVGIKTSLSLATLSSTIIYEGNEIRNEKIKSSTGGIAFFFCFFFFEAAWDVGDNQRTTVIPGTAQDSSVIGIMSIVVLSVLPLPITSKLNMAWPRCVTSVRRSTDRILFPPGFKLNAVIFSCSGVVCCFISSHRHQMAVISTLTITEREKYHYFIAEIDRGTSLSISLRIFCI
eukprot:gene1478-867_t